MAVVRIGELQLFFAIFHKIKRVSAFADTLYAIIRARFYLILKHEQKPIHV